MLRTKERLTTKQKNNIEGIVADGKGNYGNLTHKSSFTESLIEPNNGNKSTVSPASSSMPKDNRASELPAKAVQGIKKIFNKLKGPQEKKSKKKTALSRTLASQRSLRLVETMTIEKIQSELKAISNNLPCNVIHLVRNNHKTINKEINSGKNTEIIDLVDEAGSIQDKSTEKTAKKTAVEKRNKEFLTVARNALRALARRNPPTRPDRKDLKNWQITPNLTKGEQSQTDKSLSQSSQSISVNPDKTLNISTNDNSREKYKECDVICCLTQLQSAINTKTFHNIINITTNNLELINQEPTGDKKDEIKELLKKAVSIQNKEGNNIFHIFASYKKLNKEEEGVLELFNSLENLMQSAMEVRNNEGKTPLDVAKGSGNKKFTYQLLGPLNIRRVALSKPNQPLANVASNDEQAEPQTPRESPTRPNIYESEEVSSDDSEMGSPGPSPEAKDSVLGAEGGLASLANSRGSSLSSSTTSLNSTLNTTEKTSDPQTEEWGGNLSLLLQF